MIHGSPGTGKTNLVETVFVGHVATHPAVLSSASNRAVDNLLKRLAVCAHRFSPDYFSLNLIARVGREFDPDITQFSFLQWLGVSPTTKKVRKRTQNCLNANVRIHANTLSAFAASGNANCVPYVDPAHDYCFVFVDEAAQETDVASFGALLAVRSTLR